MRKSYSVIVCTLLLAFLIPAAALAAEKNSAKLLVSSPVVLNGSKLAPGHYTFQWTDSGKVTVLSGKKTVATAEGKVTPGKASPYGASLMLRSNNGASELTGIQLKDGRTIDFTGGSSSDSGAGSSPRK